MICARIGTVIYVLWGLLHYNATYNVYNIALGVPPSMVQGRLFQDAFFLSALATAGIVLAVKMNWHNSRMGFWLNALVLAVTDVPFILFVLVPGYAPFWPGAVGRRHDLHRPRPNTSEPGRARLCVNFVTLDVVSRPPPSAEGRRVTVPSSRLAPTTRRRACGIALQPRAFRRFDAPRSQPRGGRAGLPLQAAVSRLSPPPRTMSANANQNVELGGVSAAYQRGAQPTASGRLGMSNRRQAAASGGKDRADEAGGGAHTRARTRAEATGSRETATLRSGRRGA